MLAQERHEQISSTHCTQHGLWEAVGSFSVLKVKLTSYRRVVVSVLVHIQLETMVVSTQPASLIKGSISARLLTASQHYPESLSQTNNNMK